jgi:hypothetical protein
MIGIVKTGDEHLTVHVLFSIIGLGNQIERTDMSLLQASNFRVTIRPERPAVSVLFKPTGRRYTYTAVADRAVRSRRGSLAPGFCVDRNGVEIGRYDDSEIQRQARKLALATAEKVFRGS